MGERGQREGWRRGHRKGGIPGREGPLEEGDSRRQGEGSLLPQLPQREVGFGCYARKRSLLGEFLCLGSPESHDFSKLELDPLRGNYEYAIRNLEVRPNRGTYLGCPGMK